MPLTLETVAQQFLCPAESQWDQLQGNQEDKGVQRYQEDQVGLVAFWYVPQLDAHVDVPDLRFFKKNMVKIVIFSGLDFQYL